MAWRCIGKQLPRTRSSHQGRAAPISTKGRFVAYYCVSTAQQGQSDLGLEAQRKDRAGPPERQPLGLITVFSDVEQLSGEEEGDAQHDIDADQQHALEPSCLAVAGDGVDNEGGRGDGEKI